MPSMSGMFTSSSTRSNVVAAPGERFFAVGRRRHFETGTAERDAHHVAHRGRIVHGENARHARGSRRGGRREQRFHAEQARSVADDAASRRASRPCAAARRDRARMRTAAASWKCRCARPCRRRASPAPRLRDADTATASAQQHLSRCSWLASTSVGCEALPQRQPRQLQRRALPCAFAWPSWYSSGSFGLQFTDSLAVSALAVVALAVRDIAQGLLPAAAKLLKQFTAEQ